MNQEENENESLVRPYWRNCDTQGDSEIFEIDKMEDSIGPLDDDTAKIRQLISGFELCYHEADKEAEYIAKAIGAGRCPERSNERPSQRKKELENYKQILSSWCENPAITEIDLDVGDISADELVSFIGPPSPLKVWQVERVVDKINEALDPSRPYHNMALDLGHYGEPGANPVGEHYKDSLDFVKKTVETIIHDTIDGHEAKISLAMAIDMLEPCNWDFVGSVVTILKAIGGDLHPDRPYACHQRNVKLSPLRDRLRTISNTLGAFWKPEEKAKNIDEDVLTFLGELTPVKRWLAASLDKTIRLHLEASSDFWLTFS
ncbi:MAG: hypothetical protein H8D56_19420 [Planctomycetes bacterium]|nr:hypothetical protein [Planctomycetota bacterium]MBL7142717.1 hypothetical protein [Phycisphaerae bacterium]